MDNNWRAQQNHRYSPNYTQSKSNQFEHQVRNSPPILKDFHNAIYQGSMNNHLRMCGLGILMWDNGDLMISQFQHNVPLGQYFYFDSHNSLCFYGTIKGTKLQNINYVYSRKNSYLKTRFKNGNIVNQEIKIKNKSKTQLSPKNSVYISSNKRQPLNLKNQFVKVTDFLCAIVQSNDYDDLPEQQYEQYFSLYEIDKNQMFFGRLEKGKPIGLGIIFVDEWPVCYGYFENGQLNGLAHVQQNPLMIIDGIFEKSKMMAGWVLDIKHETTSFGIINKIDNKFQLIEQNRGILNKKIIKFRQKYHLKSLTFINNYAFQITPYKMWPTNYIDQIKYQHVIYDIIHNFSPSCISEISRVAQLSSNRFQKDLVDLIIQHNQQKQSHNKVTKILETRLKKYQKQLNDVSPDNILRYGSSSKYISHSGTASRSQHSTTTKGNQNNDRKRVSQIRSNLDKINYKYFRK